MLSSVWDEHLLKGVQEIRPVRSVICSCSIFLCKMDIYVEIIIEPHAAVGNNTEAPVFPTGNWVQNTKTASVVSSPERRH